MRKTFSNSFRRISIKHLRGGVKERAVCVTFDAKNAGLNIAFREKCRLEQIREESSPTADRQSLHNRGGDWQAPSGVLENY